MIFTLRPALATALVVFAVAACRTPPDKERVEAETAVSDMVTASRCGTAEATAAQNLLKEAQDKVNEKKWDEARALFVQARDLARQAEEKAKADPECAKLLADRAPAPPPPPPPPAPVLPDAGGPTTNISAGDTFDSSSAPGETIYFAFNKYDLSAEAREVLDRVVGTLERNPQAAVSIAGHCDERGSEDYNLALGDKRAAAAKQYLVRRGIAGRRITTASFGEEQPAETGSGEDVWAKNRRDEIRVTGAGP